MLASLKSEESSGQLQLVERDDMDDEEDVFEAIDKLIEQGINAGDVKKLQDAGIYGLMMHTKKNLSNIEGLSEAKVDKIREAAEKLLVRKSVIRSQALDELLVGGMETLSITEKLPMVPAAYTSIWSHGTTCIALRTQTDILLVVDSRETLKVREKELFRDDRVRKFRIICGRYIILIAGYPYHAIKSIDKLQERVIQASEQLSRPININEVAWILACYVRGEYNKITMENNYFERDIRGILRNSPDIYWVNIMGNIQKVPEFGTIGSGGVYAYEVLLNKYLAQEASLLPFDIAARTAVTAMEYAALCDPHTGGNIIGIRATSEGFHYAW